MVLYSDDDCVLQLFSEVDFVDCAKKRLNLSVS